MLRKSVLWKIVCLHHSTEKATVSSKFDVKSSPAMKLASFPILREDRGKRIYSYRHIGQHSVREQLWLAWDSSSYMAPARLWLAWLTDGVCTKSPLNIPFRISYTCKHRKKHFFRSFLFICHLDAAVSSPPIGIVTGSDTCGCSPSTTEGQICLVSLKRMHIIRWCHSWPR